MTELLEKAFAEASRLSSQEQDRIASWILDELQSEQHWEEAFTASEDVLSHLADEALAEHKAGRTRELNPEKL